MRKSYSITHITSAHERYDDRILFKECLSLAKVNDYQVSLIVADGRGDEIKDGVSIFDTGKKKSRLSRIVDSSRSIYAKAIELNSDIYHFHDPELLFLGLLLKRAGKKVVYDAHEDYPKQILFKNYIWRPMRRILSLIFNRFELLSSQKFDFVVVPQPLMTERFAKFCKTIVVENFAILNNTESISRKSLSQNTIFHAGSITRERGVINFLNALNLLSNNIKVFLAGSIDNDLMIELQNHPAWKKIAYLGFLPFDKTEAYYNISNLGFILNNNTGQYAWSYSVKQFEYMKHGIPFVMPNFGEWLGFNERFKCGLNVNPTNSSEVASAINELITNKELALSLSKNGQNAMKKYFCWDIAETKLLKMYEALTEC